jgi:hypothetical protein
MVRMRKYLLMTVAGMVLAGCAGGHDGPAPSLTYNYVEAKEVPFSESAVPQVPMPLGGIATTAPPPEKKFKSASAKIAAEVRKSRRNALNCSFEGSIMTCPYQNGLRHQVIMDGASAEGAKDSDVTLFYLEPGEGTPEIIFGNPEFFTGEVTAGGVDTTSMRAKRDRANGRKTPGARLIIAVKNYKPGERTSLTIATGSRIYLYDLIVPSCKQSDDAPPHKCNAPYNPVVQHTYESDQPKVPASSVSSRSMPAVSDTRYSYDGPAEFLPREWSAYNDGINTYILPPARLASRPVPFLPQGSAPSFSVDPQSHHYVIRGLPGEVLFKRGDLTMTVRREH